MKKHFHIILLSLIFSQTNSKNLDHKKIDFSKEEIDYLKNAKEDVAYVSTDVKHQIKKLCKKGIIKDPQKELQEFCQSCNNNWKIVPMRIANAAIAQTKSLLSTHKNKFEAKKYNKVESILNRYHKNLETKKAQFFFKANDKAVDASGTVFFNDLVVRDVLRVESLFRTTKPNGELGFRAGHDNHVGQAVVSRIPVRVNFQPTNPDAPFAFSVVGTTSLRSLVVNQDTTIKGTLNVNTNIFVGGSAVVLNAANVGNGTGLIFQSKSDNTLNFRSLVAGTNIDFDTTSNNNQITISAIGDGTGDVVGPAGATNNAIAKFNGNSGKTIQNSGVIIDSSNNISTPGQITAAQFNGPLNGNATSSTSFTGPLSGDVTGTQNATVVSLVGGKTAAQVSTSVDDTLAATSANTPNTLVKRDGSGNFSAGTITANLNGNANTATTATNFSGPLSGDVTGTQNATVVSLVGGKTAAQVSTSVDDTLAATSANTPNTLVKRDGAGNYAAATPLAGTDAANKNYVDSTTGAVTGANVGAGTGQVFRDKIGSILNFRTLLQGTGITITNNANDITIASAGGSGDVTGPANSTNNAIARYDNPTGTTPKVIKNSGVTIDDTNNVSTPGNITAGTGFTATTGDVTISSGNLALTNSTSSTTGNITKAGTHFIHNFHSSAANNTNTFVGVSSGNFTISGGVGRNVGVGHNSLQALITGSLNVALGKDALTAATIADSNIAIGDSALKSVTSGSSNIAIGTNAFQTTTTTGINNIAIGTATMPNVTNSSNIAIGANTLTQLTSGTTNIGIGRAAFFNLATGLSTGSRNIGIGELAGQNLTGADSNNIIISNNGVAGDSNTIRLGTNGSGSNQQNRCFIAGITGATSAGGVAVLVNASGQLGTTTSSKRYKRDINDMSEQSADLMRLRPVSFKYNQDLDKSESKQYGLVAEEVEQVMPDLVVYKDDQPETVKYHILPVLLLNELQRLRKEHNELKEKMVQQNKEHKEQIEKILKLVS